MALKIIQIIIAIILIIAILIQRKGSGLSAAFGGDGNIYRTKRGLEKNLHIVTIILVIAFIATAFLNLIF